MSPKKSGRLLSSKLLEPSYPAALAFLVFVSGGSAQAQNWRGTNPDQPNGYHASEAASHYHGNNFLPAQQQNGYRASEARSHYGGSRYEPSSGWNRQQEGGWGSAYRSNNEAQSSSFGRWGSNVNGRFGSSYSHPYWQSSAFAQQAQSPQSSQVASAAAASFAGMLRERAQMGGSYPNAGSFMQSREQSLQNQMNRGTAGFNRIY